jgi:hypothetical protein
MACGVLLAQWARVTPQGLTLFGWRVPQTCLSRAATGRPCPGCGTTRSVVLALQLRLGPSMQAHPSGVYVAAWLAGQVLARGLMAAIRPGVLAAGRVWIADLAVSLATLFLATNLSMAVRASGQ